MLACLCLWNRVVPTVASAAAVNPPTTIPAIATPDNFELLGVSEITIWASSFSKFATYSLFPVEQFWIVTLAAFWLKLVLV